VVPGPQGIQGPPGADSTVPGPQGIQGVAGVAGIQVVNHGAVGSTARPAGVPVVYWVGTATPANALTYDFWAAI